jgi:long-subunit fatty acid transport protein
MFRSAAVHHLKGEAAFAFTDDSAILPFLDEDTLPKAFPNQDVKGLFLTPSTYAVGVSTPRFWNATFALDFHFQDYRRFRDVPLNFSITEEDDPDVRTPAEQRLVFDFRDSFHIALGMEKPVSSSLTVRAGYLFDRSPVVDKSVGPLFPDSSRHSVTGGLSMQRGNKEFTVFYEAMQFVNRTTNVPENTIQFTNGEYRNFAHLFGFGFRIFPGRR